MLANSYSIINIGFIVFLLTSGKMHWGKISLKIIKFAIIHIDSTNRCMQLNNGTAQFISIVEVVPNAYHQCISDGNSEVGDFTKALNEFVQRRLSE